MFVVALIHASPKDQLRPSVPESGWTNGRETESGFFYLGLCITVLALCLRLARSRSPNSVGAQSNVCQQTFSRSYYKKMPNNSVLVSDKIWRQQLRSKKKQNASALSPYFEDCCKNVSNLNMRTATSSFY